MIPASYVRKHLPGLVRRHTSEGRRWVYKGKTYLTLQEVINAHARPSSDLARFVSVPTLEVGAQVAWAGANDDVVFGFVTDADAPSVGYWCRPWNVSDGLGEPVFVPAKHLLLRKFVADEIAKEILNA